jgi:tetratricopeptide (TPR) repeat protein
MSQSQLQNLLAQKKYRQAIEEMKKLQRSQPDLVFTPTEADVWRSRGQQELDKKEFKAAENSFRQVLKLGITVDIYYWLAKTLLVQNRLDGALELIGDAFERKILPKDDGICYLKLLLIQGAFETVENLITTQAKRFSAAQINWARGVLELQAGKNQFAIISFGKVKKPLTVGDSIDAWIAYAHQRQGNWDEAAAKLKLSRFSTFGMQKLPDRPILQKLAVFQHVKQGNLRSELAPKDDRAAQEIFIALKALQLMSEADFHEAGHLLLHLKSPSTKISELIALKSTILTMAGEQAMSQGATDCAIQLWQPLLQEKDLNPQLVINLLAALKEEDEDKERERLLIRFITWIEEDAKQNPTIWPQERLNLTLAHAHCQIADCLVELDRARAAHGSIDRAARICPTSPEVLARQGYIAIAEDEYPKGIELLIRALDGGCEEEKVYELLQEALTAEDREDEGAEIRKRHGKKFGDLDPTASTEVKIEPWIEALYTGEYDSFSHFIQQAKSTEPTLEACRIFDAATKGKPTGSGTISIDIPQATANWDRLLAGLTTADKLPVLQTIALSIQLLSKRDKGIAALITRYISAIFELIPEIPAARAIHLMVLAVKENKPDKLQIPLKAYLDAAPQPGNALALLQLQVRWFAQTTVLRSFIETALAREQQHPLLLLAKATTYSPNSSSYEELKAEGFDLARRLQDAKALEAFRMEDRYTSKHEQQKFFSSTPDFGIDLPPEFQAMFEEMIRLTLGNKVPRAELERMMPMLKLKFMSDMLKNPTRFFGDDDDDDDDDDDFYFDDDDDDEFIFEPGKKRKRSFMDL